MWGNEEWVPFAKDGSKAREIQREAQDRLGDLGYGGNVRVLSAAERNIRDGGIGIDLDVHGLSPLWAKVDWYLDLGVLQGDKRRKRLSPGRKNLLPDAKLESAQTRLRNNLYKFSYRVTAIGNYRYVPNEAFLAWKEAHDAIVADFYATKQWCIDHYEELKLKLIDDYRDMATETWESIQSRGDPAEVRFTQSYTLWEFQDAVVAKALSKLPSPEEMEQDIHIVVNVATWMLPVEAMADELERQQLITEAQEEAEKHNHWLREERAASEAAEAKYMAAIEKAKTEKARAEAEADLIEFEKQEKMKAVRRAQLELARESVHEIVNPFDEMLNDLRAQMYKSTRDVLDNIAKHNRVVGKQVTAIQNMIGLFRMLDAAGDDELAHRIENLEKALDAPGLETKRDTGSIVDALNQVAMVAMEAGKAAAEMTEYSEWDALNI